MKMYVLESTQGLKNHLALNCVTVLCEWFLDYQDAYIPLSVIMASVDICILKLKDEIFTYQNNENNPDELFAVKVTEKKCCFQETTTLFPALQWKTNKQNQPNVHI